MSDRDVVIRPGVTLHSGWRYLGAAQRDMYKPQPGDETLEARARKFIPPERALYYRRSPKEIRAAAEAREKMKTLPPVVIRNIEWDKESRRFAQPRFLVNCPQIKKCVAYIVANRPSLNNPFYQALSEKLEGSKFVAVALFFVIERGRYWLGEDEEPLRFMRVTAKGDKFILPLSFPEDCANAILKVLFS